MDDETKVIGVKWDGDVYMPAFPRHYNERCVPVSYIALDEDNKFMIDKRFTPPPYDLSTCDSISYYSPGVWEKIDKVLMGADDHPQPVNLTSGALGVRCEE